MSPFDRTKVDAFVVQFNNDDAGLLYFLGLFRDQQRLVPIRVMQLANTFTNFSWWEKVNILYALSERAEVVLRLLRETYTHCAREADDQTG